MKKLIFLFLVFIFSTDCIFSQPWTLQNSGITKKLNSVSATSTSYAWICGENGTILKTTNQGDNWINLTGNGVPSALNLLNIFSHKEYYYYTQNYLRYAYVTGTDSLGSYIYMTSNSGLNWNKVLTVTGTGARINSIWFRDTLRGFAEGEPVNGRWSLWKTSNRGVNWDSTGLFLNGLNYTGFTNNISGKITNVNDSLLFFGANYNNSESRIFRSTNFGKNWTLLIIGVNKPMTSIFFIRTPFGYPYSGPDVGLIGGNKFLGKSTNSGNNWIINDSSSYTSAIVSAVTDLFNIPHFIIKTDSLGMQTVYTQWWNYPYPELSGIKGFRYAQGMKSSYWMIGDSGKIYHRGILYPLVKKIGIELPENFSLSQNYPNPFNPTTTISYKVASYKVIKLVVFDILGKEVTVLVNEKQSHGTYETTFDGSGLPSGVYFYSLYADGNLIETKKMVLIK